MYMVCTDTKNQCQIAYVSFRWWSSQCHWRKSDRHQAMLICSKMKLSAEHTEAAFFLPMPGKPTEQMTPMKPATSPAALSHHFYLPCSSIHQRWPTAVYCIFINKFYWLRRGEIQACYNTGPTSFNFSAMYAFISLQGPQNNCGWANTWKRAYQAMQTGFKREALNSSDEPWFYLHLGTGQSTSLQSFEWQSRSFHIKTHLLQPLQLRARISHRTPWKNNFFRVKQTGCVQLRGS